MKKTTAPSSLVEVVADKKLLLTTSFKRPDDTTTYTANDAISPAPGTSDPTIPDVIIDVATYLGAEAGDTIIINKAAVVSDNSPNLPLTANLVILNEPFEPTADNSMLDVNIDQMIESAQVIPLTKTVVMDNSTMVMAETFDHPIQVISGTPNCISPSRPPMPMCQRPVRNSQSSCGQP